MTRRTGTWKARDAFIKKPVKIASVKNIHGKPVTVKVGDTVGFKCDIEQYGRIIDIERSTQLGGGYNLILENKNGFIGEYIGGMKITHMHADDCWVLKGRKPE